MLTDAQIDSIADKINAKINIPLIGERLEGIFIRFGIRKLDEKLQEVLPPELYKMLEDAADGLSEEEVEAIKEKVVNYLNSKVNIPILNEEQEGKLIGAVIDEILEALKAGKALS